MIEDFTFPKLCFNFWRHCLITKNPELNTFIHANKLATYHLDPILSQFDSVHTVSFGWTSIKQYQCHKHWRKHITRWTNTKRCQIVLHVWVLYRDIRCSLTECSKCNDCWEGGFWGFVVIPSAWRKSNLLLFLEPSLRKLWENDYFMILLSMDIVIENFQSSLIWFKVSINIGISLN